MKNLVTLLLLAFWLALGSWYYTCKVKNLCSVPSIETTPSASLPTSPVQQSKEISALLLKKAYLHIFKAEEDLHFQEAEETVYIGPVFNSSLDSIARFLKQHPSVTLTITAPYSETEENVSNQENLGLARAYTVQQMFVNKGIAEDQILLAATTDQLFSQEQAYNELIDFKFSESYAALNDSDVKATYRAIEQIEQGSQFYKDGEYIIFSAEPEPHISQIDYYLNKNKEHLLQVNVPFTYDEEAIVDSLDIGLVRALDLKQQLATVGIKKENILIDSRLEVDVFDNTGLSHPQKISYNFVFPSLKDEAALKEQSLERALSQLLTNETQEETNESEEETATVSNQQKETTDVSPMRFNSGSHDLVLTQPVLSFVEDLTSFLEDNPDKSLLVVGHADNRGEEDFNFELGRIRGYAARRLLINYKVSPNKIRVISEGEFSPIASNDLEEGRRLNRRVEIDIQ